MKAVTALGRRVVHLIAVWISRRDHETRNFCPLYFTFHFLGVGNGAMTVFPRAGDWEDAREKPVGVVRTRCLPAPDTDLDCWLGVADLPTDENRPLVRHDAQGW